MDTTTAGTTTLDGLLDRRISIEQPKEGFRVAVDTVLLASAVPAHRGERVADFGCGVGGAMLCLAARVPGISVTGIELQDKLAALAIANIARNGLHAELEVRRGDVTAALDNGVFDHVMINPPYHEAVRHDASANTAKATANTEKAGDLARWIAAAVTGLKATGTLTLIHRADRKDEIMAALVKLFGCIELLPLLPKADAPPKRIIIRAHRMKKGGAVKCRPFILQKDAGYTAEAEAVLRHMKAIDFIAA